MQITPYCICAVVTVKALESILDNTGSGAYKDTHPWYVARELLQTASANGERLPILFASGSPLEFSYWALIKDIDVEEFHRGTWETRCEFEPLAPVNPIWSPLDSIALYPSAEQRHREAVEPVKVHRQFLDENLIRPYAVCETPPFVGAEPSATPDDPPADA